MISLTTQVLEDEIKLAAGLKGINKVDDKWMLHFLQDVALSLGVGRVLGVADNHGLESQGRKKKDLYGIILT